MILWTWVRIEVPTVTMAEAPTGRSVMLLELVT
jgi:hypothetical protein